MDQAMNGISATARCNPIWCCAFRLTRGGKEVRDRVFHLKVVSGEEEAFIASCAKEMAAYLQEHQPKASGKQKQYVGAVVAVFRFSRGKRTEQLNTHKDPQISLEQLLRKDLTVLENAFALALVG